MRVLVTGVAGFIGFHVAAALLARGNTVIGIDNLNDYYKGIETIKATSLAIFAAFFISTVSFPDRKNSQTCFECGLR